MPSRGFVEVMLAVRWHLLHRTKPVSWKDGVRCGVMRLGVTHVLGEYERLSSSLEEEEEEDTEELLFAELLRCWCCLGVA